MSLRLSLPISLLVTSAVHPAVAVVPSGLPQARIEARTFDPVLVSHVPGREADARVAAIAFRLGEAGRARCPALEPGTGLVLQHLSQFHLDQRAGMIAARGLDRGPGVIVVVPDGPASVAGVRPGDVLIAVDGIALPAEPGLADAFEALRAHARADAIHDLLIRAGDAPVLTLLRDGTTVVVRLATRPICPSRIHLARSEQRNAYADGRRVLLTTGLVDDLRNDDELAFVIAHEMAHNILQHAAIMRGGQVTRGIGRALGRSGQIVRRTEHEADMLAGELMLDAGFDPTVGAQVLRRMGSADLALFADHAPVSDRIAAMAALVQARRER